MHTSARPQTFRRGDNLVGSPSTEVEAGVFPREEIVNAGVLVERPVPAIQWYLSLCRKRQDGVCVATHTDAAQTTQSVTRRGSPPSCCCPSERVATQPLLTTRLPTFTRAHTHRFVRPQTRTSSALQIGLTGVAWETFLVEHCQRNALHNTPSTDKIEFRNFICVVGNTYTRTYENSCAYLDRVRDKVLGPEYSVLDDQLDPDSSEKSKVGLGHQRVPGHQPATSETSCLADGFSRAVSHIIEGVRCEGDGSR